MKKLNTFPQFFLSIATLDKNNKNIKSIKERNINDSIIEFLNESNTLSDLARIIGDFFLAFISKAKNIII